MTTTSSDDAAPATTGLDVRPPYSDDPITEWETTALITEGLFTKDDYPEYSQNAVLRAYRLGFEDAQR